MDDALDDSHHQLEWAAHCDEYDDTGVAIDILRAQRKHSIFVVFPALYFLYPHICLGEGQFRAVH